MRYLQASFFSFEVRLLFLIKFGALEAGKVKGAFFKWHFLPVLGIQENAKFSISFALKISTVFFTIRRYLSYYIAEMFEKLRAKYVNNI